MPPSTPPTPVSLEQEQDPRSKDALQDIPKGGQEEHQGGAVKEEAAKEDAAVEMKDVTNSTKQMVNSFFFYVLLSKLLSSIKCKKHIVAII